MTTLDGSPSRDAAVHTIVCPAGKLLRSLALGRPSSGPSALNSVVCASSGE
jgi:hypothetical protein